MVEIVDFDDPEDTNNVRSLIQQHHDLTGSEIAAEILAGSAGLGCQVVKVAPKKDVAATARVQEQGKVARPQRQSERKDCA